MGITGPWDERDFGLGDGFAGSLGEQLRRAAALGGRRRGVARPDSEITFSMAVVEVSESPGWKIPRDASQIMTMAVSIEAGSADVQLLLNGAAIGPVVTVDDEVTVGLGVPVSGGRLRLQVSAITGPAAGLLAQVRYR